MATLSAQETRKRLRALGLESSTSFAFTLREKAAHLSYDWHSHSRHQLLYSFSGRIILQSRSARWLLPPQRAAWIPAGIKHRTSLDRADTVSVFFKTIPKGLRVDDIRILRANSLLREMLVYSSRWPSRSPIREQGPRRAFFRALELLCLEWIEQELPFRLPVPTDTRVEKAVTYLLNHLDSASIASAARFSGQSVRTLRRRFLPATGMTWQQYRLQASMLQAMDALLHTHASILEVALAVGYESPSAFSRAFAKFSQSTPLAFRRSNFAGAIAPGN
jgi:AraC-like DNA-binding protein/quercetin dioxygenase-like cupin family protein